MRVLPVIDLLQGDVVRGVAGRRDTYRPIQGCLCRSAAPRDVAGALVDKLRRDVAYVADLGAIMGAEPDWESLQAISESGLRLWVDAGIRDVADAERLAAGSLGAEGRVVECIVVGLETVDGPAALEGMVRRLGSQRLVFSLDLKDGQPLARCSKWQSEQPSEIVRQVGATGIRKIIVLDLARVGTGQGVGALSLCRQIADWNQGLEVITGGGVASREDLAALTGMGIDAVLVASALHDGRIGPTDIENVERLGKS